MVQVSCTELSRSAFASSNSFRARSVEYSEKPAPMAVIAPAALPNAPNVASFLSLAVHQRKEKRASLAQVAHHPNFTPVALDDVLDDRQSQPGSALLARARAVHAVKALENALQRLGRDAR